VNIQATFRDLRKHSVKSISPVFFNHDIAPSPPPSNIFSEHSGNIQGFQETFSEEHFARVLQHDIAPSPPPSNIYSSCHRTGSTCRSHVGSRDVQPSTEYRIYTVPYVSHAVQCGTCRYRRITPVDLPVDSDELVPMGPRSQQRIDLYPAVATEVNWAQNAAASECHSGNLRCGTLFDMTGMRLFIVMIIMMP
jgi:hypothetical protein